MGFPELFASAATRHGVVWLGDAEAAQVGERGLRLRADREGWVQLFPNAWLAPGSPPTDLARITAATLTTGGAASRWWSLWLHGMRVRPRPRPQVLVDYGRIGRSLGDIEVLRSRTVRPHHLGEVQGVRAAVPARALADLAPQLRGGTLRHLVIDAEHAGLMTVADLASLRAELRPGVPGLRTLDRVLGELDGTRSDSGFEHEVRAGLEGAGIPVHPEPFPFTCEDGVTVHLDVAVPDHWVVVECDGRRDHIERRVFTTDRTRWTQVVRQWRPVWVSWDRWREDRGGVVADVRRAIELAEPGRAPALPAASTASRRR